MEEQRESGRLILYPMAAEELEELLCPGQNLLPESVLSDIIRRAVRNKLLKMQKVPKDVRPWFTYWRIVRKEDALGMGLIGSKGLPGEDGFVELGYGMGREYRRMGYMAEGMVTFLDWLYGCIACKGARLRIHPANLPSIKTAETCGFDFTGKEEGYLLYEYPFVG